MGMASGVSYKEQWLEFLRPIIQTSIPEVKAFIDEVINIDDDSAGKVINIYNGCASKVKNIDDANAGKIMTILVKL